MFRVPGSCKRVAMRLHSFFSSASMALAVPPTHLGWLRAALRCWFALITESVPVSLVVLRYSMDDCAWLVLVQSRSHEASQVQWFYQELA